MSILFNVDGEDLEMLEGKLEILDHIERDMLEMQNDFNAKEAQGKEVQPEYVYNTICGYMLHVIAAMHERTIDSIREQTAYLDHIRSITNLMTLMEGKEHTDKFIKEQVEKITKGKASSLEEVADRVNKNILMDQSDTLADLLIVMLPMLTALTQNRVAELMPEQVISEIDHFRNETLGAAKRAIEDTEQNGYADVDPKNEEHSVH